MAEIKNIDLTRMNNGAHFAFVSNTYAKASNIAKIKEKATAALDSLKTAVAAEDEALKISQKSLLTDEITAADRKRDTLYSAYRKLVKGSLYSPLDDQAEAAKVLYQNLKDYGIDPQMQLDKETGLMTNLIGDLTGKYSSQVATLGLSSYISALNVANGEVNTLIMQRADERGVQVAGALRTARTATDAAYKTLIKTVNALLLLEYDESYDDFVNYMNEEIDRNKQQVLAKKKASSSASTSTSAPTFTENEESASSGR